MIHCTAREVTESNLISYDSILAVVATTPILRISSVIGSTYITIATQVQAVQSRRKSVTYRRCGERSSYHNRKHQILLFIIYYYFYVLLTTKTIIR